MAISKEVGIRPFISEIKKKKKTNKIRKLEICPNSAKWAGLFFWVVNWASCWPKNKGAVNCPQVHLGKKGQKSPNFQEKKVKIAIFRAWVLVCRQYRWEFEKHSIFLFFTCSQIWLSLLMDDWAHPLYLTKLERKNPDLDSDFSLVAFLVFKQVFRKPSPFNAKYLLGY